MQNLLPTHNFEHVLLSQRGRYAFQSTLTAAAVSVNISLCIAGNIPAWCLAMPVGPFEQCCLGREEEHLGRFSFLRPRLRAGFSGGPVKIYPLTSVVARLVHIGTEVWLVEGIVNRLCWLLDRAVEQ